MKENSFKIIHEYAEARGLRKYFTLSNAKINIIYNRDNDVLRNNDDYYDYDQQTYMINNNNKDKDGNNLDYNNILQQLDVIWERISLSFGQDSGCISLIY